jgi:hypothetical protein
MTVAELIMRLSTHDPSLRVSITDGWTGAIYEGSFPIRVVTLGDDEQMLDIGIGGYQLEEER